jgi:hypothetical protein
MKELALRISFCLVFMEVCLAAATEAHALEDIDCLFICWGALDRSP